MLDRRALLIGAAASVVAAPSLAAVLPDPAPEARYWNHRMTTDAMAPAYRKGDRVIVDYQSEPAEGDDALIEYVDAPPDHASVVNVEWQDMWSVGCMTHNPKRTFTVNRSEIRKIARVVPIPEFYGWLG